MTGDELRRRIKALGWCYVQPAERLGIVSLVGLHHNMRGERPVSRQTEMILGLREQMQNATDPAPPGHNSQRRHA
jgi:hypothetical protein